MHEMAHLAFSRRSQVVHQIWLPAMLLKAGDAASGRGWLRDGCARSGEEPGLLTLRGTLRIRTRLRAPAQSGTACTSSSLSTRAELCGRRRAAASPSMRC